MKPLLLSVLLASACGSDSSKDEAEPGQVDDCSECGTRQFCVVVFGDERTTACETIPDACGSEASCTDEECASAMDESCPESFWTTGCSDTFPPTIVSCNP